MMEVWRLHRKRRKIVARADREAAAALKANDDKASHEIEVDCYLACQKIDQCISRFSDQAIRQEAQELDVAFPRLDDEEMWNRDEDQCLLLSFRGRTYLRERIDAEKTRRFEAKTLWVTKFWLPLLAALVGIIGAMTGLVAVWHRK
jgi:hypothetical protein